MLGPIAQKGFEGAIQIVFRGSAKFLDHSVAGDVKVDNSTAQSLCRGT